MFQPDHDLSLYRKIHPLLVGYHQSQAIFTAHRLGLFERLQHPARPDDLARELAITLDGCQRLLGALVQLQLIEPAGDDRYRNSELGATLSAGQLFDGLVRLWSPYWPVWGALDEALRTGEPLWQRALGTQSNETFTAIAERPELLRGFVEGMAAYSRITGAEIAQRWDFTPYQFLVDVGGGVGNLASQIGRRYPHLRGAIMDVPPVIDAAPANLAAHGLVERFTAQPGNMFERAAYPLGADVLTLGWVLHDWPDERCAVILRNCFEALPLGGALLISEAVLEINPLAPALNLQMLAVTQGGRERRGPEYVDLLHAAGFAVDRLIPLDGPRDLIVAHKPA